MNISTCVRKERNHVKEKFPIYEEAMSIHNLAPTDLDVANSDEQFQVYEKR